MSNERYVDPADAADANADHLVPTDIVVDADPDDELIDNADESVERAGW